MRTAISLSLVKIGLKTKFFYHYAKFCRDPFLNCNYSSSCRKQEYKLFQLTVKLAGFFDWEKNQLDLTQGIIQYDSSRILQTCEYKICLLQKCSVQQQQSMYSKNSKIQEVVAFYGQFGSKASMQLLLCWVTSVGYSHKYPGGFQFKISSKKWTFEPKKILFSHEMMRININALFNIYLFSLNLVYSKTLFMSTCALTGRGHPLDQMI